MAFVPTPITVLKQMKAFLQQAISDLERSIELMEKSEKKQAMLNSSSRLDYAFSLAKFGSHAWLHVRNQVECDENGLTPKWLEGKQKRIKEQTAKEQKAILKSEGMTKPRPKKKAPKKTR